MLSSTCRLGASRACVRHALASCMCAGATHTQWLSSPAQHGQQRRGVRFSGISETLRPIPGQTAGSQILDPNLSMHPDEEEERRRPVFRHEVAPAVALQTRGAADESNSGSHRDDDGAAAMSAADAPTYLQTMYKWGYDSLTLFSRVNEDCGPWWQANSSVLTSTWSEIGDYGAAGLWSGVHRYTFGVGEYNMRPYTLRGRAWGGTQRLPYNNNSNKKATAAVRPWHRVLAVRYGAVAQRTQLPLQRFCVPHTPEHAKHDRIRNPPLRGYREMTAIHAKRVLREVQYHLGYGLRFYIVDGVLGSHPDTATAYRVITDNPTHAYYLALAAIRKRGYVAYDEVSLVRRLSQSPFDEWAWRRPGVVVYDAAAYAFEAPRIVEEFGGPRPHDLGLTHHRCLVVDPYSIPMKACLTGEPACEVLLDTIALLCARWGYYADEQGLLTLPSESLLSRDGVHATLVLTSSAADADVLRASPRLYGAHHHRLARGLLSRAWDVAASPLPARRTHNAAAHDDGGNNTTTSAATDHASSNNDNNSTTTTSTRDESIDVGAYDLVEVDEARAQRPLPTRVGLPRALSHRLLGRRRAAGGVGSGGFVWPHRYTDDAASRAYAAGLLFRRPAGDTLHAHPPRPSCIRLVHVDVVVLTTTEADEADGVVDGNDDDTTQRDDATAVARAVEVVMRQLRDKAFVYAEEAPLRATLTAALSGVRSVRVLRSSPALLRRLARGDGVA